MNKEQMKEQIIAARKAKGISWEDLASKVGKGTTWVTSACFGMNSTTEEVAKSICSALDLGEDVCTCLQEYPYKSWDKAIPTDPVVYRFHEIVGVYGETIKEIIGEKFGDGIMSAIDFSMDIDKEENPKGDRVVITLNGKFLKYTDW